MSEIATEFLREFFSDKPDDHHILIWTKSGEKKISSWHTDVDEIKLDESADVYFGVGTAPMLEAVSSPDAHKKRIAQNEVQALYGLWVDIDLDNDWHEKDNLPSTEHEAMSICSQKNAGLAPTVIIHSGGGLHAYWLFYDPWILETDKDRLDAYTLTYRWQKSLMAKSGYTIDATHDLSRIMRLPGSMNQRGNPPVQARVIFPADWSPGDEFRNRYRYEELSDYVQDFELPRDAMLKKVQPETYGFILNANASVAQDWYEGIVAADPEFALTWNRKRKDLKDSSPSAYDMSMASHLANNGFSRQTIVDVLIAARRKNGEDLKLRYDYYHNTLEKAFKGVEEIRALDDLHERMPEGEISEEYINETLELVSTIIEVQLKKVVKYMVDPPIYRLKTEKGEIVLGTVDKLISQQSFRCAVASTEGLLIKSFKPKDWTVIAQHLLNACEMEEIASEDDFVQQYLEQYSRSITEDPDEAGQKRIPLLKDGYYHISPKGLRDFLVASGDRKVTAKELGVMMRGAGHDAGTLHFNNKEGKRTSTSVWRVKK